MRHDVAVVIVTICRDALLRAVRSLYCQQFSGRIQILIGVDCDPDGKAELMRSTLAAECPGTMTLTWLDLGYSTSRRHGGPHTNYFGGSLPSALSFLADSEIVMYLGDDDWLAPGHCTDVLAAIDQKKWAFAYSIFADGNSGEGLCIDELESVGVNKGMHAGKFGGFVRPSGMVINKMQLLDIMHLWSCSPWSGGNASDRLVFDKLRHEPHGCTGNATVFYALDPKDILHTARVAFMRSKGVEFRSDHKVGSVR